MHINLDEDITLQVNELAKSLNSTPYIVLLCVYYILLYKYSNQSDIVVGTPVIGRNLPELQKIVGMFVNTVPLKNHIEDSDSFLSLLSGISTNILNDFEYQDYPFENIVNDLNIKIKNRNPLFDTMFIYQNNLNPNILLGSYERRIICNA